MDASFILYLYLVLAACSTRRLLLGIFNSVSMGLISLVKTRYERVGLLAPQKIVGFARGAVNRRITSATRKCVLKCVLSCDVLKLGYINRVLPSFFLTLFHPQPDLQF